MSRLYTANQTNLSLAWAEVLVKLMERGVSEISPVVVTISEFKEDGLPVEVPGLREALDAQNKQSCRTIASTIFPNSLWNPTAENDAQRLFERYERVWPRIAKCALNNKGVYFRRLTAYAPRVDGHEVVSVNQLAHVIETYKGDNHRHSTLQAAIFDPTRDHSHARQRGFPCLQQVAFGTHGDELEVTGAYALQHHVPKAYGNYLGLCWLGRFMAKQMGLKLGQVTCIASSLKLGNDLTKAGLKPLCQLAELLLRQHEQRVA